MNDILNKTIVLVLNRNWQAIHVRTPQEAFCMMATNVATDGASPEVLHALGIPLEWAERCEDAAHVGHDGTNAALALRLEWLRANQFSNFVEKITQLGSYGGGNHFGECEVVRLLDNDRARGVAEVFRLRDSCVGFLSHCGSRGFGNALASGQFRALQQKFATWDIPLPGDDKELVYAPLGTPEADAYLDDMALAGPRSQWLAACFSPRTSAAQRKRWCATMRIRAGKSGKRRSMDAWTIPQFRA